MKKTFSITVKFSVKEEDSRVVKVKSYKRVRNGKTERVRAHSRRY